MLMLNTRKLFRTGSKRLSRIKRLLQLGRRLGPDCYVLYDTHNTVYLLDDRKMIYPKQLDRAKKFKTPAEAAADATKLYGLWAVVPVRKGVIVGEAIYVPNAAGSAGPTQFGKVKTAYMLPLASKRERP